VHGDLYEDRMRFDGDALQVLDGADRVLARVDLQSFAVSKPAAAPRAREPDAPGGGGPPWVVIGAAALALAALGWTIRRPRSSTRTT
jgi:MYXO-CTERM domain-containing protein